MSQTMVMAEHLCPKHIITMNLFRMKDSCSLDVMKVPHSDGKETQTPLCNAPMYQIGL